MHTFDKVRQVIQISWDLLLIPKSLVMNPGIRCSMTLNMFQVNYYELLCW
jgi:hypothetical protein